jgi:hypothetical protein
VDVLIFVSVICRFSESPLLGHMRQRGCSKNVKRIGVRNVIGVDAAATIESWKIILIELDDNCEKIGETVFNSKTSSKTVEF